MNDRDTVSDAYTRMGHLVRTRCRRIMRDDAETDDVLQEVFVRTWRFIDAYRAASSKLAWLYTVGDRCCFDALAKRASRAARVETVRHEATSVQPSAALEDREVVLAFLHCFDERVQRVAVLHYLDEMTQDEIAASTGWSRQTVWKKLQLLRERAEALRAEHMKGPTT